MEGIISKVRSFDAFPKINEDFYSRTLSGGIITIASSIVMFLLFFSELRMFIKTLGFLIISQFFFIFNYLDLYSCYFD